MKSDLRVCLFFENLIELWTIYGQFRRLFVGKLLFSKKNFRFYIHHNHYLYTMMMRGSSNSSQRMRTTTMSSMKTTTRTMTENKRHHPRVANERRKGRREKSNSFVQRVRRRRCGHRGKRTVGRTGFQTNQEISFDWALDLTGLDLTEFPMEIFDVTNDDAPLTDLQISNNRIYHIPDEIGDLQLLERLGLAGNRLTKLPESVGKLKRLQGLWAHGNLLKSLPESICSCQSLRNLSVAGNRIRKLPENLSQLVALEELSVPGNQLLELPNLGKMFNLSDIDLHGNCIEDLSANGNDFQFLKALETFSLQGNRLKSIPGSLGNLKRLRSLNLAENRIQQVPEELRNLQFSRPCGCSRTICVPYRKNFKIPIFATVVD